jgi:hypothetical protein
MFESILALASGAECVREADAAELLVIEDVRRLGQETLITWANQQLEQTTRETPHATGVHLPGVLTQGACDRRWRGMWIAKHSELQFGANGGVSD